MSNIQIKKLEKIEISQVQALNQLIFQLNSRPEKELTLEELSAIIEFPTNVVFVALTEEGELVGTVILSVYQVYAGRYAVLENLVVDSGWRGRGVARRLVQAVVDEAKVRGANSLKLRTGQDNEVANTLYKSFGFKLWTVNTYVLEL